MGSHTSSPVRKFIQLFHDKSRHQTSKFNPQPCPRLFSYSGTHKRINFLSPGFVEESHSEFIDKGESCYNRPKLCVLSRFEVKGTFNAGKVRLLWDEKSFTALKFIFLLSCNLVVMWLDFFYSSPVMSKLT